MVDKFENRYRIPSARLQHWDYSREGAYFITICSAGRACLFGSVLCGVMTYSPIGDLVLEEWEKSFIIRDELYCDEFQLMPNHLHAILRIKKIKNETADHDGHDVETHDVETHGVETHGCASLPPQPRKNGVAYRAPKSISSFVAGFKSAVTVRVNKIRNTPGMAVWQTRFHDHIIRNDAEYNRIAEYIRNNPKKWDSDRFFPQ